MNQERDRIIVDRWEKGESMSDLAETFSISRERVRQIVKTTGQSHRRRLYAELDPYLDQIRDSEGLVSVAQVSQETGIRPSTIFNRLRELYPDWDYHEAKHQRRLRKHQDRVEGKGFTTCSLCGEVRSWADMTKDKTPDGIPTRSTRCKPCVAEMSRKWNKTNANRTPKPTVTHQVCSQCGKDKPASEFYLNRRARSGLQGHCKECGKGYYK